ncbi:hypothetical protein [Parasitella parasitica]|uniref:Uncharacterized protein n=1 Tax=Parasitella parasitica TaxID=35722 RepID=A0A0B7NVK6_9FUNG|nr:hypothetical protein [Parasitella parasitica]
MDEILNHISDISTGRAPLNINITIPTGANYQVPAITTTTSSPHTYDAFFFGAINISCCHCLFLGIPIIDVK